MITSTLSFAMHIIITSYRVLAPVSSILQSVLPYTYRNMASAIKKSVDFNTKHLKTGDPLPKWNGKLRLYNMRYCPYAQRSVLALIAKNVEYEIVNIDLVNKPEWLKSKSPLGKVPALEIADGVCITESLIVSEYVDEVFSQRPLLPKDSLKRAKDKILVEMISPMHAFLFKILRAPDTINEDTIKNYNAVLQLIEDELKQRRTTFLDGTEPGYADYMIWPWFERVPVAIEFDSRIAIDDKKYPSLVQYIRNMQKDPVVKEYIISNDIYKKFFESYKTGAPDYELLNK
ncbi:pyrimidodiazepine synthase-like [Pieris napi]|uniref:pyrimidodiazepine synthase-like n=1 Tax=Pieris napi TaxID=78633 RepID=UPI001FB8DC43|nr:pyrimidodiazepine synthase-like [Pieris napi]